MISPRELRERLPNPKDIIAVLDKYIIGQEYPKKMLALMLLNRGLLYLANTGDILLSAPIQKSNVLLLGPTGTGKTALIKALSETMELPICIFDVTSITAAGYVGGKVEDILFQHYILNEKFLDENPNTSRHFQSRDMLDYGYDDPKLSILGKLVETGVIYLDEIDKLVHRKSGNDNRDINGDMVQNELLKLLDTGNVEIVGPESRRQTKYRITKVKTDDILFICGGAFSGLSEIIAKRLNKNSGIGFNNSIKTHTTENTTDSLLKYVTNQDLIEYGFKPEFLGRIPLRAALEPMSIPMLKDIITKSRHSVLRQYQEIFRVFGIDLSITDDGVEEIAKLAIELKIGARSLKNIFSNILTEELLTIFDKTEEKLVITKEMVIKKGTVNEI